MPTLPTLTTFSPSTVISSSQMNANFAAITTQLSTGVTTYLSDTQTLTNKTIGDSLIFTQIATPATPSSGFNRLYVKSDSKLYTLDSVGTETQIGASNSFGINLMSANPDFESNTTGYNAYADAAGTSPVDGTGGSPVLTITRTTTSPLYGIASGLITKDAANRQGNGISYDITVPIAMRGTVATLSHDYTVNSGTYASGDMTVWFYDVTNSQVIQPSGSSIDGVGIGISVRKISQVQIPINCTTIRVCWHVSSTSASAYALKIDNVSFGPQPITQGSPVTEWTTFTPTWSSVGTPPAIGNGVAIGRWRRIGDSMDIEYWLVPGSTTTFGTSTYTLSMPPGFTIDVSKMQGGSLSNQTTAVGRWAATDTSVANYEGGKVGVRTSTSFIFSYQSSVGDATTGWTATTPFTFGSGDEFSAKIESIPVVGWSSNVQMSSDTDTRVCAAKVTGDPASATVGNPIIVPTVSFDTHGGYNATTGRYTIPVPGYYKVFGALVSASAATTLSIYKNGSLDSLAGNLDSNGEATFVGMLSCIAGDIIDIRPGATVDATSMVLCFERVSGPSQIAATEYVGCSYYGSTTSITNNTANVVAICTTKRFDSHNAYNTSTGVFTAPAAGKYLVTFNAANFASQIPATTAKRVSYASIRKNSTVVINGPESISLQATTATTGEASVSGVIDCIAGDTLDVTVFQSLGANGSLLTGADTSISISREGL